MQKTSAPTLEEDLALAHKLIDLASTLACDYLASGSPAEIKADGSPVTVADREIELAMRRYLFEHRPEDAVLGEEFGSTDEAQRCWLLDPIDGTFNFIKGNRQWGSHVALQYQGNILLGIVSRPILPGRWWAAAGQGAYRSGTNSSDDGVPIQVSSISKLEGSRVTLWGDGAYSRKLKENARWIAPHLNAILELAEGELEAVIDMTGAPWDHAPLVVIVQEAGGHYTNQDGGTGLLAGEGFYTNGAVHDELLQLLGLNGRSPQ